MATGPVEIDCPFLLLACCKQDGLGGRVPGPVLFVGILSLVWMILRARGVVRGVLSESTEVATVSVLWGFLFVLVSASASSKGRSQETPVKPA